MANQFIRDVSTVVRQVEPKVRDLLLIILCYAVRTLLTEFCTARTASGVIQMWTGYYLHEFSSLLYTLTLMVGASELCHSSPKVHSWNNWTQADAASEQLDIG